MASRDFPLALLVVVIAGCSSSSSSGEAQALIGSCDNPQFGAAPPGGSPMRICYEYRGNAGSSSTIISSTCTDTLKGAWSTSAGCSVDKRIGGCRVASSSIEATTWFYEGDGTVDTIKAACASQKQAFIAP